MNNIIVNGNKNQVIHGNQEIKETYNTMIINYNVTDNSIQKKDYSQIYRNYIKKFEELQDYLFNSLFVDTNCWNDKYKFSGKTLNFGKNLIDWLIGKNEFPAKELKIFQEEIAQESEIEEETILKQRWKAMEEYFNGNIEKTMEIYNNILDNIKNNKNIGQYFKDDILIDGRNIQLQYENVTGDFAKENQFQGEIEKNKHKLANPIYDRIKIEIYDSVHKNIFNYKNRSKYTIMYGIGLEKICNQIQNLLFFTIFYGSITHLKLCRSIFADIMYSYAEALDDEKLYAITLIFLALSNRVKEFERLYKIVEVGSDFWHNEEFINELINKKVSVIKYYKDEFNCLIFKIFGRYLNEKDYVDLEELVLKKLEEDDKAINIRKVLNSLKSNIWRIKNKEKLFDKLLLYIKKGYSALYQEICNIINSFEIEDFNNIEYDKFKKIIDNIIPKIENNYLDISNAIIKCKINDKDNKYDKYIFGKEHNVILYNIESSQNSYETVKIILKIMEERYENREKSYIYTGYSNEYMIGRDNFIKQNYTEDMELLILNTYIPLAKKILNSEKQSKYEKIKHLKILAYILIENNNEKYKKIIYDLIKEINQKSEEREEFRKRTLDDLYCNTCMIQYLLGDKTQQEIINIFYGLILKKQENILCVLECFSIIKEFINIDDENSEILYSLFKYCYHKKFDIEVKCESYEIARALLKSNKRENIINFIKEQASNCTLEEARKIVIIVKYERLNDKEIMEIKRLLLNNNNFYIKAIAEKNIKNLKPY